MNFSDMLKSAFNLLSGKTQQEVNSQIEQAQLREQDLADEIDAIKAESAYKQSIPYLQKVAKEQGYVKPEKTITLGQDGSVLGMESLMPETTYRNPKLAQWLANPKRAASNQHPIKSDELISGVGIASQETGVPFDLLMDIAGLESMAGYYDRPINNYPGQYDDEKNARGAFMFLKNTAKGEGLDPEDRYSATESARAAARKLNKGQLGEWDITDKPGAGGGKLTDWYSEDELAPYSFASLQRRQMLQGLAKR